MNLDLLSQIVTASGSSSSGDPQLFGLLFFLSGFIFYGAVHRRYRNTDKRHLHESETEARILGVRAWDQHVDTLKGLKDSKIKGANNHTVRAGPRGASPFPGYDALNDAVKKLPGGRGL